MGSQRKYRPLVILMAFFRWFCKPQYREDIEGDLLERFQERVILMGTNKANWLFIKDVLSLFRPRIIGFRKNGDQQKQNIMKSINWLKLSSFNLLVILMIISPFIPGPSNKVVFWLSILGQMLGTFGLLLTPVALAWLIVLIRKRSGKASQTITNYQIAIGASLFTAVVFLTGAVLLPNPMPKITFLTGCILVVTALMVALSRLKKGAHTGAQVADHAASFVLAAVATSIITFISLFMTLFVLVGAGMIPGLMVLLLTGVLLSVVIKRIKQLKHGSSVRLIRVPVYFLSVPVMAFLCFMFLIKPLSHFSREFAIKRSQLLITQIEGYKQQTGQYPASIQELDAHLQHKTADPSIMGIDNFRYNRINDRYSISFSQWKDLGSLEEIVLYDKTNLKDNLTGSLATYNYSFDLHRVRSAFASHDTRFSNWRYYLVD